MRSALYAPAGTAEGLPNWLLVYVAAFAPDAGENLGQISEWNIAAAAAAGNVVPDSDGYVWISRLRRASHRDRALGPRSDVSRRRRVTAPELTDRRSANLVLWPYTSFPGPTRAASLCARSCWRAHGQLGCLTWYAI